MGNELDHRQSGCSTSVVILTVLIVIVFLLAITTVGGVLLLTRMRTAQQHAVMAHERAMMQAKAARQAVEQAYEQAEAELEQAKAIAAETQAEQAPVITIQLDKDGRVWLDGEPVDPSGVEAALRESGAGKVVIEADKRCLFEHVARQLEICQNLDIDDLEIKTLENE